MRLLSVFLFIYIELQLYSFISHSILLLFAKSQNLVFLQHYKTIDSVGSNVNCQLLAT
jgi:hypothetical protein